MGTLLGVIALLLAVGPRDARAQTEAVPSPLLLTTMPPTANARIMTAVDLGYNERAFEPVAGERLEPQRICLPDLGAVGVVTATQRSEEGRVIAAAALPPGRPRG
jgi:hypothetical protein